MKRVLIFGGTTEGGNLANRLAGHGFDVVLFLATEYGKSISSSLENIVVCARRLDEYGMACYLTDHAFDYVVDATHPYACLATQNIYNACVTTNTTHMRLKRSESGKHSLVTYVEHPNEAVDILNDVTGNIFLAIGSKEIEPFIKVHDFEQRCFVRMLPMVESLQKAADLGFRLSNIICMQGPFGVGLNKAMFEATNAKFLVTKDSGDIGGFDEKIDAALQYGCQVIVIARPAQIPGYSYDELLQFFNIEVKVDNDNSNNIDINTVMNADFVTGNAFALKSAPNRRLFPLPIEMYQKKVLVIGGGKVAERRIGILRSFGAVITLISPEVTPVLSEAVRQRTINFVNKKYESSDIKRYNSFLIIAATNDRNVNATIANDADAHGVLVIVSDCREECNCYFPAIAENDRYLTAVISKSGDHHGVRMIVKKIRNLLTVDI